MDSHSNNDVNAGNEEKSLTNIEGQRNNSTSAASEMNVAVKNDPKAKANENEDFESESSESLTDVEIIDKSELELTDKDSGNVPSIKNLDVNIGELSDLVNQTIQSGNMQSDSENVDAIAEASDKLLIQKDEGSVQFQDAKGLSLTQGNKLFNIEGEENGEKSTDVLNSQQESGNVPKLKININHEAITKKLETLKEQIENIEKAVMSYNNENVENILNCTTESTTEIIESILLNWTNNLQNKYKMIGVINQETIHTFLLKVIDNISTQNNLTSLTEAVNQFLNSEIDSLSTPESCKKILDEAMENLNEINLKSYAIEETEAIQEIDKILEANKFESNKFSTEQKLKLLIAYKVVEFSKIYSICEDKIEVVPDENIDEVSNKLINFKRFDPELKIQLIAEYDFLCNKIIVEILEKIDGFQNVIMLDQLKDLITTIITGLEEFSSNKYDRHHSYEAILKNVDNLLYGKSGADINQDLQQILLHTTQLREKIELDQWKTFIGEGNKKVVKEILKEQQKEQEEQVEQEKEALTLDVKEAIEGEVKEEVKEEVEVSLDVCDFLIKYFKMPNDPDGLNIDELQYHIKNKIKYGNLTSTKIYELIDNLSKIKTNFDEIKKAKTKFILAYLINRGDQVELLKIKDIFQEKIKYRECLKNYITETQKTIIQILERNCGLLQNTDKENYTDLVTINLNKLDILISKSEEDYSYSKRIEQFKNLKDVVEKITSSENKTELITDQVESEISNALNKFVFSKCPKLSTDIFQYLNEIINVNLKIPKEFKRDEKTFINLKLEELFDNTGRIDHEKWKKASIDNKTVTVLTDGQNREYYRLCKKDHFNDLKHNKKNYEILVNEYAKELSIVFKIYKLKSFMDSIDKFNAEKSLANLIDITKGLIYFTSLYEEHAAADNNFETYILNFVKGYYDIMKYLMVPEKSAQTLLSDLRISLDFFIVGIQQQRNLDNNSELSLILKSLKKTLNYKTYKESNFNLFIEEKEFVQKELLASDTFCDTLHNIATKSIPEIIWLRRFIVPECSGEFFNNLIKLIMVQLPADLSKISKDDVTVIENRIKYHKNKILIKNLVPNHIKNVDQFLDDIKQKKLTWKAVLSNQSLTWHTKLQKLYIILCDHCHNLTLEVIENLLNDLLNNNQYDINKKEIDSFLKSVLVLYGEKILKEKSMSENNSTYLRKSIANTFTAWDISSTMETNIVFLDILTQIKELSKTISNDGNDFKTNVEVIQQKFIFKILNIKKEKSVENNEQVNLFSYYYNNESPSGKIAVLKLLILLPKNCYPNKNKFKCFILDLIKNIPEMLSMHLDVLQHYTKEIANLYYDYFLDDILSEIYGESDQLMAIKCDVVDAIQRLYNNNTTSEFLQIIQMWLESETEKNNAKSMNFFLVKSIKNLKQIVKFLSIEEKNHLFQLLYFGLNKKFDISNENTIEIEILHDEIIELINEHENRSANLCCTQDQTIFQSIKVIFNETSINMWEEELIHLRYLVIREFILGQIKDSDHGKTKISDILNAYRYFQTENSNSIDALNTLEILCNNIDKFTYLDEIKDSIFSLIHEKHLENIEPIIKSSSKRNLTLNILFQQINTKNDTRLKNAIQKFSFILSHRNYPEIKDFCNILLIKIREQQRLNDFSNIIELLIKSKAYLDNETLKNLQNNNISLWNSILLKIVIYNDFNQIVSSTSKSKEKNKIVDLLYQIYEDKGILIQKTLFSKIKNLNSQLRESVNIKKLNHLLNKILHKSFDYNNIEKLETDLTEWENILFENNSVNNDILPIKKILSLMKNGDKIDTNGVNESIKSYLNESNGIIEDLIKNSRDLKKSSKICADILQNIDEWQAEDIKQWSKEFTKRYCDNKIIFSWHLSEFNEVFVELISVIIRAVILYDHHLIGPRDTQLISLFLFLNCNQKGRLGNVYTGEGKTLITVMLATCFGLIGKKVDVVTSSKILAVRDSKARENESREGYKGFFEMFNLNANNNCDEECEKTDIGENERKKRYSECSIIYGETSYFQRDILLSKFFKKGIREGSAIGNILILDEVDSMMIDNASRTLYISHDMSDLRHLRDIFIHIWAAVHTHEESHYSPKNVKKIKDYINDVIENNSNPDSAVKILVPKILKDFVAKNLETWIENAYYAKCMGENDEYFIGDHESEKQNEVIIMDKDTGVEQTTTKWCNGLHQFIQLRHNGKLSDISLKAIYLSNAGYFQSYDNLYGMTGTVGGISERLLLHQVYGIDFFEMPRFKTYRFEYDFESEYVARSVDEWLNKIIENIDENMDQELKYNENDITSLQDKLVKEENFLENINQNYINSCNKKNLLNVEHQECTNLIEIINSVEKLCNKLLNLYETYPINNNVIKELSTELKCNLEKIPKNYITFNINQQFDESFFKNLSQFTVDFTNKQKEKVEILDGSIKKIESEINCFKDIKNHTQNDIEFYRKELTNDPGAKRTDSRRAILIICENIADLNIIENKIRTEFADSTLYTIYRYALASKKFDKSCLEAGDIVIATNIAGRGTDLEVTKQVEENGGLHVLLPYMPKNLRIEKQAFGRTARAGNRGTATFIVYDPRKQFEDIDILQLKNERNDKENVRLNMVQNEQLPKVELEDDLFLKFNSLQQDVESKIQNQYLLKKIKKINYKGKDPLALQMDNLKNNWAIWLNKMNDKFEKVHETGRNVILNEYNIFEQNIYNKINNEFGLTEGPAELNKLGRIYMESDQFSEAIKCFNYVIENDFMFSSIASYYNSYCFIQTEGRGLDTKIKIKSNLKNSLKMLEEERSKILSRNQILKTINDSAKSRGKALQSNCFAKQNEGEAQILSVFINSINSAIGYEINSNCLNGPSITETQAEKVFDKLLQEECNVIKDFRISKKIIIGSKIFITDIIQQQEALNYLGSDTNVFNKTINFLKNHNSDVIIFSSKLIKENENIIKILMDANIISERNIFKKVIKNYELIQFPDNFYYCKENVLDDILLALENSEKEQGYHTCRIKKLTSFEHMIYTKEKFMKDAGEIIKAEEIIKISSDIRDKLFGKLNHKIFYNKGDEIKKILCDLFYVDHSLLIEKINKINNINIFFNKRAEIESFCSGKLVDNRITQLKDKSLMLKEQIINGIKIICCITEKSNYDDNLKLQELLDVMGLNFSLEIIRKDQLISLINKETNLTNEQILGIFDLLENHSILNIDFASIEAKFRDVKNENIFFGKRPEIKNYCLELSENKLITKEEVISALKLIVNYSENSLEERTNFEALLIHLDFNVDNKYEAIISYKEYSFNDEKCLAEIRKYLDTFNLKNCIVNKTTNQKLAQLDLSVHSGLLVKSNKIIEILQQNLGRDNILKKETFSINDDEFEILRAILEDLKFINSSILQYLKGAEKYENEAPNIELNNILMKMYYSKGVISDQSIAFKDAKSGSKELFNRLRELEVINPPKINFPLGKLKSIPKPMENFDITNNIDPTKRIAYIKRKVEEAVIKAFQLERKSDLLHEVDAHVLGGFLTESSNKDLDEKIEVITNALKNVAGSIRVFPEIKINLKNVEDMFNGGNIPPEIVEFIKLSFNQVLEYREYKGFDWDCFICGMIGVAQIAVGITLEAMSGGSLHFFAQTLISEGVGDIIYAIEGAIRGNFNWKSYRQHKVQSFIISMITCGVGSYAARGSQVGQYAISLATKRAIFKAIYKSIILEGGSAVLNACVSISADEISKVLVDEIVNVQFVQYLEKWTKNNSEYRQKINTVESQMHAIYNKYGITNVKSRIDNCIESTLNELTCGTLANQIFAKVTQLLGAINKGLSAASQRLARGSGTVRTVGTITSIISKAIKASEFIKKFSQFAELCTICNKFCDHLSGKLSKLSKELNEQIKNRELVLDEKKIAQEKLMYSISGEIGQHIRDMEKKMHITVKLKIKDGFMQPAVMSLLHTSIQPLKKIMCTPFLNAIEELKDHIDERAEEFMSDISYQDTARITQLTEKQKKGLEWRKDIINIENIEDENFLHSEVANFPNETIESLKKEHGSNLCIMIRNGNIYVILPTYKEFCGNIANSELKSCGNIHIQMAATQENRKIEILSIESDGSTELKHHEIETGSIEPVGDSSSSKESLKICYIEGENGEIGHYAPVIKDENGNWKVIRSIGQNDTTKGSCFAQSMMFLKEYEKSGDISAAQSAAENNEQISKYYKNLAKSAMNNRNIQNAYYNGCTVKENRIIGGFTNRPFQQGHDYNYPCEEGRITVDYKLAKPIAKLLNTLNVRLKEYKAFKNKSARCQRRSQLEGHETPAFGVLHENEDTNDKNVKEKMMMCALSVTFTDGSSYNILTLSGDCKFFARERASINKDTGERVLTGVDYNYEDGDFKFVDPGKITKENIYNVYQNREIDKKYSFGCAAQKAFYSLGQHMKDNKLEIKGQVRMAESTFKEYSSQQQERTEDQIIFQKSCPKCETTLRDITN